MTEASRIEQLFLAGDQRRYHVPCPHCDELQTLKWANLRWIRNPQNETLVTSVWYVCEHCGSEIDERHKVTMLPRSATAGARALDSRHRHPRPHPPGTSMPSTPRWVSGAPGNSSPNNGFEAQGQPEKLMVFVNTRLGESYANRSKEVKPHVLQNRAEPYALRSLPPDACCSPPQWTPRTTVWKSRFSDTARVAWCGPSTTPSSRATRPASRSGSPCRPTSSNRCATPSAATCASNARPSTQEATTHTVYEFVRRSSLRRCIAIKGSNTPSRQILGRPTAQDVNFRSRTAKRGVHLYLVGTDTAKDLLFARLMDDADKPPEKRKIRFSEGLDTGYYNQLTAETYNPRAKRWELKKAGATRPSIPGSMPWPPATTPNCRCKMERRSMGPAGHPARNAIQNG